MSIAKLIEMFTNDVSLQSHWQFFVTIGALIAGIAYYFKGRKKAIETIDSKPSAKTWDVVDRAIKTLESNEKVWKDLEKVPKPTEPVKLESYFDKLPENETIEVTNRYVSGELSLNNAMAEFTTKNGDEFTCNYTRPTGVNWGFPNGNYYKGCKKDGKFVLTEMLTGWSEDKPSARTKESNGPIPGTFELKLVDKKTNPWTFEDRLGNKHERGFHKVLNGVSASNIIVGDIIKVNNDAFNSDYYDGYWHIDVLEKLKDWSEDKPKKTEVAKVEEAKSIDLNLIPGTFEVKLIDKTTSPYTFETRNGRRIQRRWSNKKFLKINTGDIIQVCDDMLSGVGDGTYVFNVLAVSKDWPKPKKVTRNIKELEPDSHYLVQVMNKKGWYSANFGGGKFWLANYVGGYKPEDIIRIIGPLVPEELISGSNVAGLEFKLDGMMA